MEVIDGNWTLFGLDSTDPSCLTTVEKAEKFIEEIGILPLFKNEIEGFSLEEHTDPSCWWCGDRGKDPWEWLTVIAGKQKVLYGKFFNKKAGFVSKELVPDFLNYRRDGYDFDALYEDGKASRRQRKIMLNFLDENADCRIMSNVLKEQAGFGPKGEKGYDGVITSLMMQGYLCNSDFRKRIGRNGEPYGWDVAEYATPESILGQSYVTSKYKDEPKESFERLKARIRKHFPTATDKEILKVLK